MMVLFPAPFSPNSATTSPGWMANETCRLATTLANSLVTLRSSR